MLIICARRRVSILALVSTAIITGCATTEIVCDAACHAQERRHNYVLAHPHLTAKQKKAILTGRVMLGMSKEEVIAVLGTPKATVDSNAFWADREQWIYEHDANQPKLYYFKFGRLHSWN